MSGGAQAVGGKLGLECVAGSVIADGQLTARHQGVWLNRNDEFVLDGDSASVAEEIWGISGSLSRETRNMCVRPVAQNRARIEPKDADGQR